MILVVGGAGYIGSHTVRELLNNNYDVVVVDNFSTGHREAISNVKNIEVADLLDRNSLDIIFKKHSIDTVIHFAASISVPESVENPEKYYSNNLIGTLNLLNVMKDNNVNNIVFSSTAAVFGNPEYVPVDEKHPNFPINPYGMTKLMVEKVLSDYRSAYGFNYIALRYFNAAGCSSDGVVGVSNKNESHLIPIVLQAINGVREKLFVFGNDYNTKDGTCIRDYIHVEDLAVAHRLAIENLDKFSGVINLGTGVGASVNEIIKLSEEITGKSCPVEYKDRRAGDPAILIADNKLAYEILGWKPEKNIKEIIQTAYNWEINKKY